MAKKTPSKTGRPSKASMEITQRSVEQLIPFVNNARTHSDEQIAEIAASIREFGFTNPVLIDGTNGIIAGHGRLLAARKLGMESVPCIELAHLSETQKRAYILADNRLAEKAGWDFDLVSMELTDLLDDGFDIGLTGFDSEFIIDDTEGLTDPDAVPDVPETPVTVLGDVWILGNHRLMCGDSTSIDAVEKLMDGQKADQFVTDPPYNVDYTGKTKDKLKIQNDIQQDDVFRAFLRDAFTAADSVMKEGAVFYIFHADSEGYNFRGACRDTAWEVRQCLIWNKQTMVMGRQDYHWKHEPILYGWKGGAGHLWATDRRQVTVLNFDRPSRSELHPTMKPVDILSYLITNNTKGSDIVLDLFGGSGSTMVACEHLGRVSRTMELDEKYCDVIITRWQDFTGKQATLESTGEAFAELGEQRKAAK